MDTEIDTDHMVSARDVIEEDSFLFLGTRSCRFCRCSLGRYRNKAEKWS